MAKTIGGCFRDQVPLEEEEGAFDDGCDAGDDFGPCSPKEGAESDTKSNTIQTKGKLFFRDSSMISTAESIEAFSEEDEVTTLCELCIPPR